MSAIRARDQPRPVEDLERRAALRGEARGGARHLDRTRAHLVHTSGLDLPNLSRRFTSIRLTT